MLIMTACSSPPDTPPEPLKNTATESAVPHSPDTQLVNNPISTDLDSPWSITFAGEVALVSERDSGKILELDATGTHRTVGEIGDLRSEGEGGLLGLAFNEPDQLFVYSSGQDGNRIQRFRLDGGPGNFGLSEPVTLIDSLPVSSIHNGGRIALGPDGMLYVGVGDAANPSLAQDLGSLGGKILRMTPTGRVPTDNPFDASLVYSYGHRNVQGLAWDSTGNLYASEFGQNTWDELNLIVPGGNYGWPKAEGQSEDQQEFTDPIVQWSPAEASPSGIAVKDDTLYIANLRGQRLRSVDLANPQQQEELWVKEYGRFRDIVLTPSGQLWALTNNTDGRGSATASDDQILLVDPEDFVGSTSR